MPNHDAAYGQLFDNPALVEGLIRHVLPPGWQQDVDFDSLHKEETSHLATLPDGLPLRREGDRLWSTKLKPGGQLFFLFLEFQSSPDRWMALRLGLYTLMVWQILVKSDRIHPGGRLPPVVPVVLYNGEDAWNSSTSLEPLIDLPTGHTLWRWQPRFEYIMIDENIYGRGEQDPGLSLVASLFGFDTAVTPAQAPARVEHGGGGQCADLSASYCRRRARTPLANDVVTDSGRLSKLTSKAWVSAILPHV